MNDTKVWCQSLSVTEPQRDGGNEAHGEGVNDTKVWCQSLSVIRRDSAYGDFADAKFCVWDLLKNQLFAETELFYKNTAKRGVVIL